MRRDGAVSDVTLAGILDGVEIGLQATNCSNTIHEQICLKVLREEGTIRTAPVMGHTCELYRERMNDQKWGGKSPKSTSQFVKNLPIFACYAS